VVIYLRPKYSLRLYLGQKNKYISVSLWDARIDENGRFRPASISIQIHNEESPGRASMRTATAARLASILMKMVAEAEKLTMEKKLELSQQDIQNPEDQ